MLYVINSVLFSLFVIIQSLEVIPTKPELKYINAKFIKHANINVRRQGRGSPYYVNFYLEIKHTWGNNLTFNFHSFEEIGGNYIPLLFEMENKLCNFYKEPLVGKMLVQQLPKNLTTFPIAPGWYSGNNLRGHLENLPFDLPFTYGATQVLGYVDVKGYITATKEPVFEFIIHGRVIQKPRNKQ